MEFKHLIEYYREIFLMVDMFHCNSRLTGKIYQAFIPNMDAAIVPITHAGIMDRRKTKTFSDDCLRLCFVGSSDTYKGLPMLMEVLKSIDKTKWELNVWGGKVGHEATLPIYYRGSFNNAMLEEVYGNADLVVVPSVWNETFSFVTLEALSFGTPVLVSSHVGAQDIVRRYDSRFVFSTSEELKTLLLTLMEDRTPLQIYNGQIMSLSWQYSMIEHAQNIIDKVYVG